jgi:ADP-ribosylglycohydrolase
LPKSVHEKLSATGSPEALTAHTRILGCLLGGAVGDAIGARAERHSGGAAHQHGGDAETGGAALATGRLRLTNATIATMFTVEGLVRAYVRGEMKGMCHPPSIVQHAHLRWAHLQGRRLQAEIKHVGSEAWPDGALAQRDEIRVPRSGGATSLTALEGVFKIGDQARNDATDCDALVRAAPFGLVGDERAAFGMALETSTWTHPHADGSQPAAAFAQIVCSLMAGARLAKAVVDADALLEELPGPDGALHATDRAADLIDLDDQEELEKKLATMRKTWAGTANQALALAIFVAERFTRFEDAILFAGATGGSAAASLVGQLLGVMRGVEAVPGAWLDALELRDIIEQLGADLALVRAGSFDCRAEFDRYPGW